MEALVAVEVQADFPPGGALYSGDAEHAVDALRAAGVEIVA